MFKQPVFQISARDTVDQIVKRVRDNGQLRRKELQAQQGPLQETPDPRFNQRYTPPQPTTPYQQAQPFSPNMQTSPGFRDDRDMQSSPGFMDPNQQFMGDGSGMQSSPGFMDAPRAQERAPLQLAPDPRFSQRYTPRQPITPYQQPEFNSDMQTSPGFRDGGVVQATPGLAGVDNKLKQHGSPLLQKPAIARPQQLTPTTNNNNKITPIPRPTDPRKGAMQNFLTKGRTQI